MCSSDLILENLKSNSGTAQIPVIVFSTSNNENDSKKCLELKALRFITKPLDLMQFFETFRLIDEFLITQKWSEDGQQKN